MPFGTLPSAGSTASGMHPLIMESWSGDGQQGLPAFQVSLRGSLKDAWKG